MRRKCNCSGACQPWASDLTRREFIGLVGAGTASLLVGGHTAEPLPEAREALADWMRSLSAQGMPTEYNSDLHTDARMHLGGIGTGNFEIGSDGRFTTWQLFNTLRDGHVPFFFGIKAGGTAWLLQTAGGPEARRVGRIVMRGEYPVAFLKFNEPGLPLQIEMRAFSPFAPLDTAVSSIPLAAFVFRLSNPTPKDISASIGAFLQNPVGYEAIGRSDGSRHPSFGRNIDQLFQDGPAKGVLCRAEPGDEARLDRAVSVYASANLDGLRTPPPDRPKNLSLAGLDALPTQAGALTDPTHTVIWLEDAPADTPAARIEAARNAVVQGATLVFAGRTMPLLAAHGTATGGRPLEQAASRPDIVFEDFDKGYGSWKVEGRAFGAKPATGTLPNQQRVSGFLGAGLVNTYLEGDGTVGRLTSPPFKIERQFIRFLVGGGSHGNTQIRLLVEGKVVRSISGQDNERLLPASWDVKEFEGKTAHLEIVDENTGGWGHINVDQIEFSDLPANQAAFKLLDELLPARFTDVKPRRAGLEADPNTVEFAGLAPRDGAVGQSTPQGLRLLSRALGKGRVVLASGPILDAEDTQLSTLRQRAYAVLCGLVGAAYTPPVGPLRTAPGFGTLALAALAGDVTAQAGFEDVQGAWNGFAGQSALPAFDSKASSGPTEPGRTLTSALAATVTVPAGDSVEVPFLLAWHYPNKYNANGVWMGCYYASQWPDARAVVREAARKFSDWLETTERFRQTFYESTLPYWLLDCVTSQASIIRHIGVVFRIANGDVYGWEGSNGCCQPTCTHVWGYEQTLARLFPDLERDMRRIDFKHQQREDGGVNNRTDVPSPPRPTGEQPFADGHASCILKAWREALNHPDESWTKEYWPHIKRAVEYLIARDAAKSGGEPGGILNDDQWNTYDEALHGVTTFIGSYYLAALRAGEEWARRMGDTASADRFHAVFEKGQKRLVDLCWNGEYFQQHLPDYLSRPGEVGPGCMSDQLIGQWWAHQLGLGYLLPKEMVRAALKSVFKHNWKADLTGWKHMPRAFAGARDKGLIICTWPKGGRPANVMLYSDEVWTGIEYQVAAHLIYEGMIEEGFAIVKGARERYDGRPRDPIPRNPWNEIECGGHYARAMSSWSLLLAASGYEYDGPRAKLKFTPRVTPDSFKSFFCGPEGWGTLCQTRQGEHQRDEIIVAQGLFRLRQVTLATTFAPKSARVMLGAERIEAASSSSPDGTIITLARLASVRAGQKLEIELA